MGRIWMVFNNPSIAGGVLLLLIGGCFVSTDQTEAPDGIDTSYLTHDRWNDGRAEVAFYRVERTENAYGEPEPQEFIVGTYLVKHTYDRAAMAKAGEDPREPVSSFKYAQFYEVESGSYQRKRSYVLNARQRDLHPLKQSYVNFDWCSNQYHELTFHDDEDVRWLMRSDDYGNSEGRFFYRPTAYPISQLPLLVRGLDFSDIARYEFQVVHGDGAYTSAVAELGGRDTVRTPSGPFEAEKIIVRYEEPVPSMIGETTDVRETYWRRVHPERHLVQLTAETGRYRMQLIEVHRSAYWEENVYERLQRVQERP